MKKNVMMRLASFLLVAVLISTTAISGTYAKYVTAESGSDKARVAKWGVNIEVDSFKLFTTDYATDDTTATFTGSYSVSAGAGDRDNVLAPGTKGSFAGIAITGTPEVAVDVAVVPTVTVSGDWMVAGDFYCPVVITVGTTAICGLAYNDATDFADAIADAIDDYSDQYPPNEDLSAIGAGTNFDISWEWAFEDADHVALGCACTAGAQTDAKDTVLGDNAVAGDLEISIGIEITVTQID